MSSHSCLIHTSHLIFLYEMSWLLKLLIPSLELYSNTLLDCNFFLIYLSLKCIHWLGYIFPSVLSLDASQRVHIRVVCCRSKIDFCYLFLIFMRVNFHKGSLRWWIWAHPSSANNKNFHITIYSFLSWYPNTPSITKYLTE